MLYYTRRRPTTFVNALIYIVNIQWITDKPAFTHTPVVSWSHTPTCTFPIVAVGKLVSVMAHCLLLWLVGLGIPLQLTPSEGSDLWYCYPRPCWGWNGIFPQHYNPLTEPQILHYKIGVCFYCWRLFGILGGYLRLGWWLILWLWMRKALVLTENLWFSDQRWIGRFVWVAFACLAQVYMPSWNQAVYFQCDAVMNEDSRF